MKSQGVRTIAFGGRPRYGPMQALGGVKGGQSEALSDIQSWIGQGYQMAINATTQMNKTILTDAQFARYKEIMPKDIKDFPLVLNGGGVNWRNAYREGDDVTPLQFVYEAAECRLFYTIENYIEPATQWVAAANAMFGNGTCVDGSMGQGVWMLFRRLSITSQVQQVLQF
jgi:hypothetical protein